MSRRGMTRKGLKRQGYILADSEAPWMPGADGYLEDGTPYFNNKASAREWAAAETAKGERVVRVDPDGGLPDGAEVERGLADKYRREREFRAQRQQRRNQRKAGARISTSRKRP